MGECAKRRVGCYIYTLKGHTYYAENSCNNPQKVCPREEGEGYEKCKSVCDQQGHAEEQAIKLVESNDDTLRGASVVAVGHTHYCINCQNLLFSKGVKHLSILEYGKRMEEF